MSTINLIIGGIDVSENVQKNSYQIQKIIKRGTEFTAFDGSETIRNIGQYYELHTSLEMLPDSLMRQLTAALNNDKIDVTFTDPHSADNTTIAFLRGENTGGEICNELDDGLYWNTSISLKSELTPVGDGL